MSVLIILGVAALPASVNVFVGPLVDRPARRVSDR